jgi:glycosyltransferase involved in cell wall biosynthesis
MINNTDKKGILILHGSSDIYGASKILMTTALFLKEKYRVLVVLSENGPLVDALRDLGIEVEICRLGILRRKYFSIKGLINRLSVLSKSKKELTKIVTKHNISIIYSNTLAVLVGAMVAKACKIKHIWHVHEIILTPKLFVKFLGYCLNKWCDIVIVVSNPVRNYWKPFVLEDKIVTIHNGIDYSPFLDVQSNLRQELQITDDTVLVGMIGRVHFWKGQKYFVELASLIASKNKNVKFIMVGDAFPGYEYLYDEISAQVKEKNLEDLIINLGYRTDIGNILNGLDIFILPSILPDPFPTVILEAMASGKPVVATMHGGALEMVDDGRTGFLIPWDNAHLAVDKFVNLINEPQVRSEMGQAGRQKVLNEFSLDNFKRSFLDILERLG